VVGYKPTARLVPKEGAFPLSFTLDSIGPLARNVALCALTHDVLAGTKASVPAPASLSGIRLGILAGPLLEELDATVGKAFDQALARLGKAGARVTEFRTELLAQMQTANAKGGLPPAEAMAVHAPYFESRKADFDPRVWQRINLANSMTVSDYIQLLRDRARLAGGWDDESAAFDAVILPTTPDVAPIIAEANASDDAFFARNARGLRNTAFANFFDLCAISLPMPTSGLPAGLQLAARHGEDKRLFAMALAVEAALQN
jgi:aspartyl-tRNA(Asn)/glutamyl-tRNA(Gln) amidotransferase subunit A